ncbi:hypothetical protein LCGC14_1383170 [marine sediment metagenome]|uniref:Uncharacterized protein n=1 Tax=marine sediment metagenome TaxID=412755 RepID=A0A0F9K2A6_9ZZZZ
MNIPPELIAGAVYFCSVFAKAMQQRNVAFMNYKLVFPISYVLAIADITVWSMVAVAAVDAATNDTIFAMWFMAFCIGTGGSCGATAAMYLHHRFFTKKRFQ